MQDEENHTPPKRINQLSNAQVSAAVKRIISTKFTPAMITDLLGHLRGTLTVASKKDQDHG